MHNDNDEGDLNWYDPYSQAFKYACNTVHWSV